LLQFYQYFRSSEPKFHLHINVWELPSLYEIPIAPLSLSVVVTIPHTR
jgi:hypothetical protein